MTVPRAALAVALLLAACGSDKSAPPSRSVKCERSDRCVEVVGPLTDADLGDIAALCVSGYGGSYGAGACPTAGRIAGYCSYDLARTDGMPPGTAGRGYFYSGWTTASAGSQCTSEEGTWVPGSGGSTITCSTRSDVLGCTRGSAAEINLGSLTATACHDQCQTRIAQAGWSSGCWVLASGRCYCRDGVVTTGGPYAGGSCD